MCSGSAQDRYASWVLQARQGGILHKLMAAAVLVIVDGGWIGGIMSLNHGLAFLYLSELNPMRSEATRGAWRLTIDVDVRIWSLRFCIAATSNARSRPWLCSVRFSS